MVFPASRPDFFVAACALFLFGTLPAPAQKNASAQKSIPVQKSIPFVTGADLSYLPYDENCGVRYYDGGKASSLLNIAKRNGWKIIRVRLWVNPDAADPKAQASSLASVTGLGRRIKAGGFEFLLDLHYSDTWADPATSVSPPPGRACRSLN